jgi:predicted flap endonuclease-1-like 5' DNA nuclease
MKPMERQSQVTRELYRINVETVKQLVGLSGKGITRYLTLNADYLGKLANRPGPLRFLELQRSYGESLFTGFREDAEQSARIVSTALERSSRTLLSAWTNTVEQAGPQTKDAAEDVTQAADAGTGAGQAVDPGVHAAEKYADEDLEQISGIGPSLARQLRDAGVETLTQVAAFDVDELADEGHALHHLKGRIEADQWVEQARALVNPRKH